MKQANPNSQGPIEAKITSYSWVLVRSTAVQLILGPGWTLSFESGSVCSRNLHSGPRKKLSESSQAGGRKHQVWQTCHASFGFTLEQIHCPFTQHPTGQIKSHGQVQGQWDRRVEAVQLRSPLKGLYTPSPAIGSLHCGLTTVSPWEPPHLNPRPSQGLLTSDWLMHRNKSQPPSLNLAQSEGLSELLST